MEREHFVAVMKRKDVKALGAIILREVYDEEESAKELESAGRLTNALIERTCLETVEEAEPTINEDEEEHSEPEHSEPETENKVTDGFDDVRKAIKKGKKKKALKLIIAHHENGSKGSVLSNLKKEAKGL